MDFVKIKSERGYGDDVWEVVSSTGGSFNIRNTRTLEQIVIYKVHTYIDRDCWKAKAEANKKKIEAAKSLGKPKKKPGK